MTCWILYDSSQYEKNRWFADRLIKLGSGYFETELVLVESLTFGVRDGRYVFIIDGAEKKRPDIVVCRTIYPLLSLALERAGARVFNNSETSRICNDKRLTHTFVCDTAVPSAGTFFFEAGFMDASGHEAPSYPAIIKTAEGHGGSGVFLVNNRDEHRRLLGEISPDGFLEQPFIMPCTGDLRVYVMGGEILASVIRTSESFKSNYSLGGKASLYRLDDAGEGLVRRIISLIPTEMDFVGIDFLVSDGRLLFNEIEDVAGTRMLYDITDIDAAEVYMEYIFGRVRNGI